MVQTQFSLTGEVNTDLSPNFLLNLGVIHRLICPHSHHQNGVVERKHKRIVEMALTMLSQAIFAMEYWDHAITSSVYLINRIPSSAIQKAVLYQKLFDKLPDYKFLLVYLSLSLWQCLFPFTQTIQPAQVSA